MAATYPTKLILAFRSGGICAFPNCGKQLSYEAEHSPDLSLGEAAHIEGEKPGSARYNPSMTDDQRNSVQNLLYMCGTDHTIIDTAIADWPTERLQHLKVTHEDRVRVLMEEGFADVAFAALESAIAWVAVAPPGPSSQDFDLVAPDEKIQRNELSFGCRQIISAGLAGRQSVAQFVALETQSDPLFPDKLKAGFLSHYYDLRSKGMFGDELFELMCSFALRGARKQAERTASIAILVYLFEICDLFEK